MLPIPPHQLDEKEDFFEEKFSILVLSLSLLRCNQTIDRKGQN